jgi:hypothetical protein
MLLAHLVPARYSKAGADEPYTTPVQKTWLARLLALIGRKAA